MLSDGRLSLFVRTFDGRKLFSSEKRKKRRLVEDEESAFRRRKQLFDNKRAPDCNKTR